VLGENQSWTVTVMLDIEKLTLVRLTTINKGEMIDFTIVHGMSLSLGSV